MAKVSSGGGEGPAEKQSREVGGAGEPWACRAGAGRSGPLFGLADAVTVCAAANCARSMRGAGPRGTEQDGGYRGWMLLVRCYFVKNARIVASKELPGLSPDEAVETARTMFEASSFDGVEVWSLTRRIFWLGRIAKPPAKRTASSRPIAMRLAPA